MAKSLVIVESPAKAKTLSRFLGRDYRVEASFGHVRDLPGSAEEVPDEARATGTIGIDITNNFKPVYVIPPAKKRHVTALRSALKEASELLLATDPDREGESISWHLREVLKPKVPVRRITFHEITREAVREAIDQKHEIDLNLVEAQESRRILDRLYGYTLSPVLWKKVRTGLSAGRVQSVAVRLIVEREEARRAFHTSVYWDLEGRLSADGRTFTASLARVGDERVASGRDFDPATGVLAGTRVRHLDEAAARRLTDALGANLPWRVTAVDLRPGTERPAPPFTTSTLTQEASRKLGFSTSRTMRIAQRLKDGVELADGRIEGIITYHRTDSTTLSEKALRESGGAIREMFGDDYHTGPRRYQTQVRNAQEAHEAIRPTDFTLTPQQLARVLDEDDLRLYELIWKRTMASQMPDARVLKTTVEFTATGPDGEACVLTASGKAIEFPGFRRAYVEGSDDPESELEAQETILPAFREGDLVTAQGAGAPGRAQLLGVEPRRHETTPPARFTEASLDQEAGGGRDRAALDLRADDRDDPAAGLRVPPGEGARPELHGVRRHAPPSRPLRRLRGRELHRGNGEGPRRDLERRAGARRLHPRVLPRGRPPPPRPRADGAGGRAGESTTRSSTSARTRRPARRSGSGSGASARSSSSPRGGREGRRRCPTTCRRPTSPWRRRWTSCGRRRRGRATWAWTPKAVSTSTSRRDASDRTCSWGRRPRSRPRA